MGFGLGRYNQSCLLVCILYSLCLHEEGMAYPLYPSRINDEKRF